MWPSLVIVAVVAVGLAVWWRARRRSTGASADIQRDVDPFTLSEPWRRHVQAALSSQRRYRAIVRDVKPGPLRDRLQGIGRQVDDAVRSCAEVAKRGDELDAAIARIGVASIERQMQHATDDVVRASFAAQLAAAERLRATRSDTDAQLRLQVVRMGELTALATEVSVGVDQADALGDGVSDVVVQLEGLRQALREVEQPGRPATSP